MPEQILLIEDDEVLRESLATELEVAGYGVTAVASGEEALATTGAFDLVLTDIRLGGMTGLQALGELRHRLPAARTLVMTGYANQDAPLQAIKLGVDDYLLKPFTIDELLGSVRTALNRNLAELRRDRQAARLQAFLSDLLAHQDDGAERRLEAARRIAMHLGFPSRRVQTVTLAAQLYGLPEWQLCELEELRELRVLIGGARNGSGPLESRLLAVADAYRAELEADRPAEGLRGRLDLDPRLVEALLGQAPPGAETPELELRRRRQRLRSLQGPEAVQEAREAVELARQLELDRDFAQLALEWAEKGGVGEDVRLALAEAETVFRFWESPREALWAAVLRGEVRWPDVDLEVLAEKPQLALPWLRIALGTPELEERLKAQPEAAAQLLSQIPESRRPTGLAPAAERVEVYLLGPMRMALNGQALAETLATRKVMSLFAFLCSHRGELQEENRLAERFWPDSDRSRPSLQNGVSQIRKFLLQHLGEAGRDLLVRQRFGYVLKPSPAVWVDREVFERCCEVGLEHLRQGRAAEAVPELKKAESLYQGDLLEGMHEEWVERERTTMQRAWGQLMLALGEHFARQHKWQLALKYYQEMERRDPCDEDACLGVLQALVAEGRGNEAVKHYHAYSQKVHTELGMTPSPRVVEAYLRLTL